MLYVDFSAGNKTYQLRLNTRNIVSLEKQIGCNPLAIFGDGTKLPSVSTMVQVLHNALQQYQHGLTLNDAYDIFDDYIADGNTSTDFIQVIVDIYKVSGLIKQGANEKN